MEVKWLYCDKCPWTVSQAYEKWKDVDIVARYNEFFDRLEISICKRECK